ncbi:heme o synthase [Candidatus Nitrosacidococcus tergens]|uniref:Protoheme IX farnesyltransferase n=1 Tax=Candidatus Nitrosacidococcus tergens TaxID=553981 RepID=A0A7G1QCR2_9GAMM|nr:heme o synthase [Candidatus Nitrosacidococcus tergens]CAB1277527.1 Protoheme IX farnesyltransferase [Candidatus Nitrosacidococcus tergens]
MTTTTLIRGTLTNWREYLVLCKPRIVALIIFTAIVGMFLSVPGVVPLPIFFLGTIGIGLGAASAAAINHLIDEKADAVMGRTKARPLPTGKLTPKQALIFAISLAILSMAILYFLINPLTAYLTFFSMIGYGIIYTAFLKRTTPQNIVLGGAAGAMPPVLGWAAVTGEMHVHAFILFLIIFMWTPPHFWALALARREEYGRAKFPMLPVTHGVEYTKQQVVLYTFLLFAVSLLPFSSHLSGMLYLVGAVGLGGYFLYLAIALYRDTNDRLAMKMFGYSIFYLAALFAFLLADHYMPHSS